MIFDNTALITDFKISCNIFEDMPSCFTAFLIFKVNTILNISFRSVSKRIELLMLLQR